MGNSSSLARSYPEFLAHVATANSFAVLLGRDIVWEAVHVWPMDVLVPFLWSLTNGVAVMCQGPGKRVRMISIHTFYRMYTCLQTLVRIEGKIAKQTGMEEKKMDDVDAECLICMDAMMEVILPCSHGYCQKCINAWNVRDQDCPTCRQAIGNNLEQWHFDFGTPNEEVLKHKNETILELEALLQCDDPQFTEF